ncbi:MAG: type I restriction enzyme M protein [Gammaproteobacteria bacterium]|jgi:type I restriction enzyme M protein
MLWSIFRKVQNEIRDTAKLECLLKLIGKEAGSTLPMDVKGGAGLYFNPRDLIQAMTEAM